MSNSGNRLNRFFYRHRNKGIPNLMLYIALGNAVVILMSLFSNNPNNPNDNGMLYDLLCFDKAKILQGEVWRLVTYVFTQSGRSFLDLIFIYFFYMIGRQVELRVGTFKFNLYYLSGLLLMDAFAMGFCPLEPVAYAGKFYSPEGFQDFLYSQMPYYLHLSLILAFATANPDAQFLLLFIIPIKAWIIALVYFALVGIDVIQFSYPVFFFPHNLFPLVGLANYFLFFWDSVPNALPPAWRRKLQRNKQAKGPKVVIFEQPGPYRAAPKKEDYVHKCTVCGRTDTTHPNLEFRYCSRCNGYHCYCIDHINNHTHIE